MIAIHHFRRFLAIAAVSAGCIGSSEAVILTPGASTPLPGADLTIRPELAGSVIADELVPFSIALGGGRSLTGTVQQRVIRETFAGTLDFYWRISLDPGSFGSIGSFRLGDFFTSSYDADYRSDGNGVAHPDSAFLFSGNNGNVNFNFSTAMRPGASTEFSRFMFIRTDATSYAKTASMDLATPGFAAASATFSTFAPVPEPATATLLVLAAVGLVAVRRSGRSA